MVKTKLTDEEKAARQPAFCTHDFCKLHWKFGYATENGMRKHLRNMECKQHVACVKLHPNCSSCGELEGQGKFVRKDLLNSNLDGSMGLPDAQDGDHNQVDDDENDLQ